MNGGLEWRGADNHRAACSGAATAGESLWKIRAKSASLHFDHTVLAELIARRWHRDRGASWWRQRIAVPGSCNELSPLRPPIAIGNLI
jgi:ribonuclease HI